MAAEEEESSEKPYEATPRKLEEARKRGEIPVSQDLITASVYAGVLLAGAVVGIQSIQHGGTVLVRMIDAPDRMADVVFSSGGLNLTLGWGAAAIAAAMAWVLLPFATALAMAAAQRALVFAPTKLKPKLSRISPVSIAKQKYGREGLFNFAKSFFKLLVYSGVLGMVFVDRAGEILNAPRLSIQDSLNLAVELCTRFLVAALVVMVTIGGVDYLFQQAQHARKQRMSLKELRDETKDSEGDPYTKQARRQRGYDIATNRMLDSVPDASVVIVNPEHYAVALRWDRKRGTAPICVAKGVDGVADRIRRRAIASGVPIYRDPPTARALHASVELDQEIHHDHYRAVAAAIRFADALRAKAKGAWNQ